MELGYASILRSLRCVPQFDRVRIPPRAQKSRGHVSSYHRGGPNGQGRPPRRFQDLWAASRVSQGHDTSRTLRAYRRQQQQASMGVRLPRRVVPWLGLAAAVVAVSLVQLSAVLPSASAFLAPPPTPAPMTRRLGTCTASPLLLLPATTLPGRHGRSIGRVVVAATATGKDNEGEGTPQAPPRRQQQQQQQQAPARAAKERGTVDRRRVVGGASRALLLALCLANGANSNREAPFTPAAAWAAATDEKEDKDLIKAPGKVQVFQGTVEQSPADTKKYRALTLANGLRVLLVSDPEAERSAAAMDVHVGHFSDPPELPGLAHFCEHMLFLGTKKYPDEASYSQYLSAHGGNSNAYTDTEDTVFYFDVDAKFLEGALDRFSEFFKSPLFTASATDRELNAIESENAKNLQSDGFRSYQLEKSRANPAHPFSKFGTGNLQTLLYEPKAKGIDTRQALFQFHEKYYIAPRMTLVVVGKEPLGTLQRWAEGMFAKVPTRDGACLSELEPWRYPAPAPAAAAATVATSSASSSSSSSSLPPPFLPPAFGTAYHVVPVQPLRKLGISWIVPFTDEESRRQALIDKPEYYVSHLLGHEGEGSLLSYLKRKGLANSLGAGFSSDMGDFSIYEVAVDLTEQGEADLPAVEAAVFSYLALLRQQTNGGGGIQPYVYAECKDLADLSWRFQEKGEPITVASTLVNNMQNFDEGQYLSGPARLFEVKPQGVREFVEQLLPTRALVAVYSKSFEKEADKEEKWYKTKYKAVDISARLRGYEEKERAFVLQKQREALPLLAQGQLKIPEPNPFIPQDMRLKAPVVPRPAVGTPIPGPALLANTSAWRVFHKLDQTFGKPKVYAIFQVANPAFGASPRSVALTRLFKVALVDSLVEFAYPAALAGLSFEVDFTVKGLRMAVGGYHDKLPAFAKEVAARIASYQGPASDRDFARYKDIVTRELQSFDNLQPYMHAGYFANLALEEPKWPIADIRKALSSVTVNDLRAFANPATLFDRGYGTALLQGNILADEALSLAKAIEETFRFQAILPPEERTQRQIAQLPLTPASTSGLLLRRAEPNPVNTNGAAELIFQVGSKDLKTKVTAELLSQLVEQPFYDDLRTQQQLGYLVFSGLRVTENIPSLVFIVQSNVADPQNVSDRMLQFVNSIDQLLDKLSPKDFDAFVAGLVGKKLEREKRLEQEAGRHWEEIGLGDFKYDRPQQEAAALKALRKGDVLEFYNRYIRVGGADRRLLTSQVFPSIRRRLLEQPVTDEEVADLVIDDELAFRRSRPLYP